MMTPTKAQNQPIQRVVLLDLGTKSRASGDSPMFYTRLRVFALFMLASQVVLHLPATMFPNATRVVVAAERNPDADGNYHVGDGVSQPRFLSGPEPQPTPEARQKHVRGTVVIWTVVAEDGTPKDVHVVRSVGDELNLQDKYLAGALDGNAVTCVQQSRYEPARFKGKPVAVQIQVKVSYKAD
jgi:TonB family protein